MKEQGETPLLPDNPAPYLTDWLFDIGPSVQGAMGECEIGYRDLAAWQETIGIELMPWEARTLRQLSKDYCGERQRARRPDAPPPYNGTAADEETVAAKVDRQFAALFRAVGNSPAN